MTELDRVCSAVRTRRLLQFSYKGAQRIIEPHICGVNRTGRDVLIGWFLRGQSQSGEGEGWRTYFLEKIRDATPLEEFAGPRDDFRPLASGLMRIYCSLTF